MEPHSLCVAAVFLLSKLGQKPAATWAKGMGPVLFPILSKGMATCSAEQRPGGLLLADAGPELSIVKYGLELYPGRLLSCG